MNAYKPQAYKGRAYNIPDIGSVPIAGPDQDFTKVSLLLHGDGADGSTTIVDSSLNFNVVTAVANARIRTAQSKYGGSSLYTDGTGDWFSVANHASLSLGSGDFQISADINLAAYATTNAGSYFSFICAKDGNGAGQRSYGFYLGGTSSSFTYVAFIAYLNDVSPTQITAYYTFSLNTWYHIKVFRKNGIVTITVNGVIIAAGALNIAIQTSPRPLTIGSYQYDATYVGYLNGYIDEFRIIKGEARIEEVLTVPTAPYSGSNTSYMGVVFSDNPVKYFRLVDNSGAAAIDARGGASGTYSGGYTLSQAAFVLNGGSVFFDAGATPGGKVSCNFTTDYTTALTIEFWMNAATTGHDATSYIIGKNEFFAGAITSFPIAVKWNTATSKIELALSQGNDFTIDATIQSATLVAGTDYHVAVVYRNAGLCEIYVDGVLSGSATIGFAINTTGLGWTIATPTELGGGVGIGSFEGRIAEVAFYSVALSSARILAHFNAKNTP